MKLVTTEDLLAELRGSTLDRWVEGPRGSVYRIDLFPFYNSHDTYLVGIRVADSLRREDLALLMDRRDFSHICSHRGELTIFLKPEKK